MNNYLIYFLFSVILLSNVIALEDQGNTFIGFEYPQPSVTNVTYANDSANLNGQPGSYYLDDTDTVLSEATVDGYCNNNGYLTSYTETQNIEDVLINGDNAQGQNITNLTKLEVGDTTINNNEIETTGNSLKLIVDNAIDAGKATWDITTLKIFGAEFPMLKPTTGYGGNLGLLDGGLLISEADTGGNNVITVTLFNNLGTKFFNFVLDVPTGRVDFGAGSKYTIDNDFHLWKDYKKMYFGAGTGINGIGDASIYYDGTNLVVETQEIGSGLLYVSNNVSATGYNTRTEVNTGSNVLETALDGNEMLNADGSINHSAFGECYNPIWVADKNRPITQEQCTEIKALNKTICENITTYPYKILQDEVDLVCMTARQEQRDAELNKNMNLYENLTEFDNGLMAEQMFFQSKAVNPNVDYTSIFSDAVPFLEKHKSKYTENLTIPGKDSIQVDDVETQIKDLQGYVLQLEFCRLNNKKWDDFNLCMDNGEVLGEKIK